MVKSTSKLFFLFCVGKIDMLVCNTYNKIYDKLILLIFKLLKAQTNKED